MSTFIRSSINFVRTFLAEFLGEILVFFNFVIAGLAWIYFSSVYAAIAVLIVGMVLGAYLYGWVEGRKEENTNKIRDEYNVTA